MRVSEEWVVPASTKTIQILRTLFPGKWISHGSRYWEGPDFNVIKIDNRYYRSDTELEIEFPKRKKRNHFIKDVLAQKLGGTWVRHNDPLFWDSPDHEFIVHRSIAEGKPVYRRQDTCEVVFEATSDRFYT